MTATASPGIAQARIVFSGRTRDGVTTPLPRSRPHGAAADHALWTRVTGYARCADSGLDPDQWFPVSVDPATARQEAAAAIAVCTGCLVRGECLVLSLRHWDIGQHGVWGGMVAADRARLRRGLMAAHSARGGTAAAGEVAAEGMSRVLRRLVKGRERSVNGGASGSTGQIVDFDGGPAPGRAAPHHRYKPSSTSATQPVIAVKDRDLETTAADSASTAARE